MPRGEGGFASLARTHARSHVRAGDLDYRQLHRGSDARRDLEDRACGWRRVVTSEHKDKVNYGPLKEFWHSEEASTEDNQNKHMVRAALPLSPCLSLPCLSPLPH